jgi:methylated-DNA-[protein]-cysteine S-methyltransferase
MEQLFVKVMDSAIGQLCMVASQQGLVQVGVGKSKPNSKMFPREVEFVEKSNAVLNAAEQQLSQYLRGQRQLFDLPLDLRGTPFQIRVWSELQHIPYGLTVSYAEQSKRMKRPKAVRAVANANGKNPVPIIVPCHRVIRSGGHLGGYTGGVQIKQRLLALEGVSL